MVGRGRIPGTGRSRRPLTLGGLLVVLALIGGALLLERIDVLPTGTVARMLGLEEEKPRRRPEKHDAVARRVPPVAPTGPRIDYAQIDAWLTQIRVEPEARRGYERDDWPHWLERQGSCLNTREEALIRDSVVPAQLSPDGCRVVRGRWLDPYTGEEFRDPKALDVDHRVPLEEAHNSGGHAWDRARRAAFANDMSDPRTLVVVSAAANRAKGSKGPEEWLPPDDDELCRYVADWVAVKARWQLTMDERERVTVGNILADCRKQVHRDGAALGRR